MSSIDSEYEETSSDIEFSEKQINQLKQFKRSVFNPFWRNPELHNRSTVFDHYKHAVHALNGKASDNIKSPFCFSPTWGLILQHLKIQGDSYYTLAEFLKIITYKKFIDDKKSNTKKPNLDRNYCAVTEAIKKDKGISHIENHIGLLDFPYLINILTLLCIQASQNIHAIGEQKKQDSKTYYNSTSPFLDFINNISSGGSPEGINRLITKTYRALEMTFYFTVRLWLEILSFLITPLWDLAKLIIAPVLLFMTFPIWYPLARHLYKDQKLPLETDVPPTHEIDPDASENDAQISYGIS